MAYTLNADAVLSGISFELRVYKMYIVLYKAIMAHNEKQYVTVSIKASDLFVCVQIL